MGDVGVGDRCGIFTSTPVDPVMCGWVPVSRAFMLTDGTSTSRSGNVSGRFLRGTIRAAPECVRGDSLTLSRSA
ncbi:hypothetical protein BH23ACT3_BH23ACT3_03440 [soil metagenome]